MKLSFQIRTWLLLAMLACMTGGCAHDRDADEAYWSRQRYPGSQNNVPYLSSPTLSFQELSKPDKVPKLNPIPAKWR